MRKQYSGSRRIDERLDLDEIEPKDLSKFVDKRSPFFFFNFIGDKKAAFGDQIFKGLMNVIRNTFDIEFYRLEEDDEEVDIDGKSIGKIGISAELNENSKFTSLPNLSHFSFIINLNVQDNIEPNDPSSDLVSQPLDIELEGIFDSTDQKALIVVNNSTIRTRGHIGIITENFLDALGTLSSSNKFVLNFNKLRSKSGIRDFVLTDTKIN